MKSWSIALLLPVASALYAEDAGTLDFLVATAGHGVGTRLVHMTEESIITSDSTWNGSEESSCIVASRNVQDGSLQWRRHVCTTEDDKSSRHHAVVDDSSETNLWFSNDGKSVRAWTVHEGALLWDSATSPYDHSWPRVWTASTSENAIVAATSGDEKGNDVLTVYNGVTGQSLGRSIKASDIEGKKARWLYVMPHANKALALHALVGHVSIKDGQTVASKVTLVELSLTNDGVKVGTSSHLAVESAFLASSLQMQRMGDNEWHAVALDVKHQRLVQFSLTSDVSQVVDISQLHPMWTSMVSISPTPQSGMLQIVGRDNRYSPPRDTMALFRYDGSEFWDQWYAAEGEEETQFSGISYCPYSNLVVAVERGTAVAFDVKPIETKTGNNGHVGRGERHRQYSPLFPIPVNGDSISVSDEDAVTDDDAVTAYQVLSCDASSMTILMTTALGTTVQQTVSRTEGEGVTSSVLWVAEEGLSDVADALLLDASHSEPILEAATEEEEVEALNQLSFSSRMQSQVNDFLAFFTASGHVDSRDLDFGFIKVAMLLSQTAHRVYGMPTSGPFRGTVQWTVGLPQSAGWHSLVHGTASSKVDVHGINGGTHSPEVLVLSSMPDSKMDWKCLDGTTGAVHSSGTHSVTSPVVQVMPVFGGFGKCRQLAVLMHEDKSISVIPNDENGKETVLEHIHANKNGLYTHVVDRASNAMFSYQIVTENSSFVSKLVGHTPFPGERIVNVAYPNRDEVVQAPSNILGDDSLLLKYLNPHLAVIMTVTDEEASSKPDELSLSLSSTSGGKRKPLGVTPSGDSTAETPKPGEDTPNLFVNVVDTVSGRVLYRTSHANASPEKHIPIVVSENWVIYAYFNEKIRRTEVGVLTLYEGMIDKNGLTAFTRPEQALSFSSLEARDAKPVVLAKTYVYPKPVTSLGITSTRGGITSRHVLFASTDERIASVPRQMLEPRRPTGEVKDSEKQEGLFKYAPLISVVSLWSPTYNQTVESTKSIVTTSAGLESQSLVLAYGGPDIFFTRLAPSKGFDLLPENFNRVLLSVVVLGLVVAVGVVRNMGKKKIVKLAWS